ncbi:MAG: agmatinase [Anaerovoracaceae bacterium]
MQKRDSYAKDKGAWCGLNRPDMNIDDVDVVVFGIPYDEGVSYRGGADEGMATLRANTFCSTPFTETFKSFSKLTVYDAGDFIKKGKRDDYFKAIEDFVCDLVSKGKFFTMIGGDHSVTIPVQRGIDKAVDEDFGIIHIDAHFDLCDSLGGDRFSHGSTERRALELSNVSGTSNIYFVGIRSIEEDEFEFKRTNDIQVASSAYCHEVGIPKVAKDVIEAMSKFSKVYITLDIDCLDPAFAAGTGTPQFGGLYSRQVLDLIRYLFEGLNIIAMDIVEIAPELDPSLTSMFAGRKILQESWGHVAKKLSKLEG